MSMGSTLDELCKLFHIQDSSTAVVYEKAGKLCFLMAQLERPTEALETDNQRSLDTCQQWIEKAVDCYLKALSESRQEDDAWKRIDESFMKIPSWIMREVDRLPIMKAFCKSIDKGLPCRAAAEGYECLAYMLYRRGADVMREFRGSFESNDYKTCFSRLNESLQPLERSMNLYHALGMEQYVGFRKISMIKTQFMMNIMKVSMELVDLLSKCAGGQDFDACLRSWFNDPQYFIDSGFKYLTSSSPDSNIGDLIFDLDCALKAPVVDDVLEIFFMTFKLITSYHYCSYSAYSSSKAALSTFFTKPEMHKASTELEKTDTEILLKLEEKTRALCLKSRKSSAESYLRFVYEEHPHPNPKWKLGSISTPEETKEALRKAIFCYHPDTNIKHGREWVLLCNEITKFLNNYNTNYK